MNRRMIARQLVALAKSVESGGDDDLYEEEENQFQEDRDWLNRHGFRAKSSSGIDRNSYRLRSGKTIINVDINPFDFDYPIHADIYVGVSEDFLVSESHDGESANEAVASVIEKALENLSDERSELESKFTEIESNLKACGNSISEVLGIQNSLQ